MNSNAELVFYRDSRRPQLWGGFFLALWMAIYIGGQVPLLWIAGGVLITMLIFVAIVLKFRPLQKVASWNGETLTLQRFLLAPREVKPERLILQREADEELATLWVYDPDLPRPQQVAVLTSAETEAQAKTLGIEITTIK